MKTTHAKSVFVAATALLLWAPVSAADAGNPAAQPNPSKDAEPLPITVRITPGIVLVARPGATAPSGNPADALTVAGETIPAGQRPVAITIRSDSGSDLGTLQVVPDGKGNYRLSPPSPSKAGVYQVTVVAPDGRGKASASFRAVEPSGVGEQAEEVFTKALVVADEAIPAIEAQIEAQIDSPAKEKAKQKVAEVRRALRELHDQPAGKALRGVIGAISSDSTLQEKERPKLRALTQGLGEVAAEIERVRQLTSRMSGADLGCHQLALASEVLKSVSALFNVIKHSTLEIAQDVIKDVVADSIANKAKSRGAPSPVAFAGSQVIKNGADQLELASKVWGNFPQIVADTGGFLTDTMFGAYCEQFSGPLSAIMNARFFVLGDGSKPPAMWWSYNYKLTGRVILYYPKNAKGNPSIRLNGRIEGYAHSFETWEDALPVMYPKLMAGTLIHKFNFPPIEVGATGSKVAVQGAGPVSGYVQGSAAAALMPNSFVISVQGVLEKETISIVLGETQLDILARHNVAAVIAAPMVGGLGPQMTWYHLPFQKVRPFLVNAADGESLKLSLKTSGNTIEAQGVFTGKVDKPKTKGDYTLKIKACNPGC